MLPDIIVDDVQNLEDKLAALFARDGERAIATRGFFGIALPGGSVATKFFPRLARVPLDWGRTEFFWGDERCVPPSDPDSNYGLALPLWLEPAGVPPERIHPMPADATDLEAAAAAYAQDLVRVLGAPPRLDLVLLGVGPEGHVCSLFPGHALMHERQRLVAPIDDSPKPPPCRLTLTLPALAGAEHIVVVALGNPKAGILRDVLGAPNSSVPLAVATRGARRVTYFLDEGAASLLGTPPR